MPANFAAPVPPGAARTYSVESHTLTGFTPRGKYAPAGEAISRYRYSLAGRTPSAGSVANMNGRRYSDVLATRRGNPLVVDVEQLGDRLHEQLRRQLGHREALGGPVANRAALASTGTTTMLPSGCRYALSPSKIAWP